MSLFLRKRLPFAVLLLLAVALLPIASAHAVAPGVNVTQNRSTSVANPTELGTSNARGTVKPYMSDRAVDGKFTASSYWYTTGYTKTLTVTLWETCYVNRFTVTGIDRYANTNLYPRSFALYTSVNGSTWTQAAIKTDNTSLTYDAYFPAVQAHYVRLEITQGNQRNNDYAAIGEFQVYSSNVVVGSQTGDLAAGKAGAATFAVATAGIADGSYTPTISWYSDADGRIPASAPAFIAPSLSSVSANAATLTMTTDAAAASGTYYFRMNLNGFLSNPVPLTVKHTVTFISAGNADIVKYVDAGTALSDIPAVPDKPGFAGAWNAAELADLTNITSDKVVNAEYTPIPYLVTFDAEGGTVSPASQTKLFDHAYGKGADGTTTMSLPVPTRTGYAFGGWYMGDNGTGSAVTNATLVSTASPHTLYAKWTAETYTLTYDYQGATGGDSGASKTVTFDAAVGTLSAPTKTGHNFDGWYTAVNGGGTKYTSATVYTTAGSTTLYANWLVQSYAVSYDSQGGSPVTGTTADYGTKLTKPADPTRTGYAFGGWYKEASCTDDWDFAVDTVADVTTLFAKWTANPYTLTYDYQGATGGNGAANKSVTFDAAVGTLSAPTKTGHSFDGWYTAVNGGGTKYTSATVYTTAGGTTLYANWLVLSYAVSYDSQSGSPVTGTTADYGTKLTKPADPTRTGYSFGGWYKEAACTDDWNFAVDTVAGGTTLFAKWTANPYTLTYDYQDATGGNSLPSKTVTFDSAVGALPSPTKTGYDFDGWYTAVSGSGTKYTSATLYQTAGGITLYANWLVQSYAVSYDSQGGSAVTGTTADYGTKLTKPADPTRTGYAFSGWYKEAACANGWNFAVDTVTGVTTLYAKWTPNTYTLTFDYQSATGGNAELSKSVTFDAAVGTLPTPTKDGYTFAGWYTALSGGTKITSATVYTVNSGSTLYALWTEISTGSGGGTTTPPPSTIDLPVIVSTTSGGQTSSSTNIAATIDDTGAVSATIGSDLAQDLLEEAREAKAARQKAVAHVQFGTVEGATAVHVELPRTEFKQLADAKATLQVETGMGSMTLGSTQMAAIARSSAKGSISLGIGLVQTDTLSASMQKKVGDKPVYNFAISVGDTQLSRISGSVNITLPYTPAPGEKKSVTTYYLDSKGVLRSAKGTYNAKTGTVSFSISRV